jgi:hypothetical protein
MPHVDLAFRLTGSKVPVITGMRSIPRSAGLFWRFTRGRRQGCIQFGELTAAMAS